MQRQMNPFYSTYPTDPGWGMAGASIARALFGDPEAAAISQYRRAQAEYARSGAALNDEKAAGERQTNTARGQWVDQFGPDAGLLFQGNPDDATPEQLNKARGGSAIFQAMQGRLPQQAIPAAAPAGGMTLADLVASVAGPQAAPPMPGNEQGDPEIVSTAQPRPQLPVVDETAMRLAATLLGQSPDVNSAYTAEYGDAYQGRELDNKLDIEHIQSRDRRYATDKDYQSSIYNTNKDFAASLYGTDVGAATSRRGQDITDRRERGIGNFGPNAKGKGTDVSPADVLKIDEELDRQMGGSGDGMTMKKLVSKETRNFINTQAATFMQRGMDMSTAVRAARREHRKIYERETGRGRAAPSAPRAMGAPNDPLGIR